MFDTLTWDYQAPPSVSCVVCRHGNLSHPFFSYTPFSVTPTSPLPQNAQNFEYCGTSRLYCRSITRRRIPHNAVYHTLMFHVSIHLRVACSGVTTMQCLDNPLVHCVVTAALFFLHSVTRATFIVVQITVYSDKMILFWRHDVAFDSNTTVHDGDVQLDDVFQVKFSMDENTTLADLLALNLHNFEDEVRLHHLYQFIKVP